MDDELEDRVLYQTFVSYMKILSKFAVGIPSLNSTISYIWKIFRLYFLRPEIILCGFFLIILIAYMQAVDLWSRGLFGRIQTTLGTLKSARGTKLQALTTSSAAEKQSWDIKKQVSAVYAVQGRRPKMEDRFVIEENLDETGISLFAIFDGHGGEFAADFAKDNLIKNLKSKLIETSNIIAGKVDSKNVDINVKNEIDADKEIEKNDKKSEYQNRLSQRKTKKVYSMTEDCINKENCKNTPEEDFLILNKLTSIVRPLGRDGLFGSLTIGNINNNNKPQRNEAKFYVDKGKINFGKMISDEVLAADYKLVELAKKTTNVAGTTALIAIMQGTILTVANVGDSRGVMCDSKGNAIPLSFDHKPQLSRERKRIQEAGGFIAFRGVWRVAGILATSRAMGDYPLKEKNFVIADPDVLTFELADHKPKFLILASDGLWDTFSNEEAVSFIKERLSEPHFGAKSLTLQSYYRGSVDNITVLGECCKFSSKTVNKYKMYKQENLAANFCGLLSQNGIWDRAIEWRILGQEQDGYLLSTWLSFEKDSNVPKSNIGLYNPVDKIFEILYRFKTKENIIQATINRTKSLLGFLIKNEICDEETQKISYTYNPYLVNLENKNSEHVSLEIINSKQIMIQFLWQKENIFQIKHKTQEKFLIMIHEESISLYTCNKILDDTDKSDNMKWNLDPSSMKIDLIVKSFTWCQWDPLIQALYYIHLKPITKTLLEKEENQNEIRNNINPTLSAYQFHDDLPTETVLNIPLNLPKIPSSSSSGGEEIYEDDTIPLRIHDSSLNLTIVSDDIGMLFVCHYYLYQPIKPPEENGENLVHFAYSVTVIHHGCVIHCVIPGIPWEKAKLMKPTFALHGDHHLLVFQAGLFMHLLDIGLTHEPCCHIVCSPFTKQNITYLVPCLKWGSLSFDSATLDLIAINISKSHLIEAFRNDTSIYNRLSIIHYFLVHSNDIDVLAELLNIIMERPLNIDTVSLLKEALVAGTYSSVKKSLPTEALPLIKLLPITTTSIAKPIETKVSNLTVGLSHETLWNTTMMLLSPQQRLSPYRTDIWTRLWEKLNENKDRKRFSSEQVTEKLLYSLACYQPEALSRCSTPMTPGGLPLGSNFMDFSTASTSRRNQNEILPFVELETCTASKQEHVISVNLRELSVHLVKHSVKQNTGFRWLKEPYFEKSPAPSHVHAVASQYATSQLDLSRALCVLICRAAGVDARLENVRGFSLIDQISTSQQYTLFHVLERYCLAVESLSFPLPQGFSSFFTYLGYRALDFDTFMQYAKRQVFELQVDVLKIIINDIDDGEQGVQRKLALLSILPRSRSRRLLNNWNHPISLMLKARDHASNILSGNPLHPRGSAQPRKHTTGNFQMTANKLSPLDTFLDLLTAKASLNELDFDLLIESTMCSLENF